MARYRMDNVDAAWLHMDEPTNRMAITGIMWFDERLDRDRFKEVIERRLVDRYPRFSQRVVYPRTGIGPHWEDDPDFDVSTHLRHIALPDPGSREQLQEFVSDEMSSVLDPSRPLWEIHVIDNYRPDGGQPGTAVLTRLHHCIADGISLARVLLSLTDEEPGDGDETDMEHTGRGPDFGVLDPLVRPAIEALRATRQTAETLWQWGTSVATHPTRLVDVARRSADYATTFGKLLLSPRDPQTTFKGKLGLAKKVAWAAPVPLDDVKQVSSELDVTVNDVLMAAVTASLRGYLLEHDDEVDEVRAVVPFNLRPLDEPVPRDLGNKFGLVFVPLPVGEDDPLERVGLLHERMNAIKESPEPAVAYGALSAVGMTPPEIQQVVIETFGSKATAIVTNVPGPEHPLYLAGSEVAGIMFWVPPSGRLGVGVSIFSYNGGVTVGVATDTRLVPNPAPLVAGIRDELEHLTQAVTS